ncbi:MAG: ABC transporter permease [Pseudomonadota bacterium]
MLLRLAAKSLMDRKGSVVLTCIAMMISIFVLLGVEHVRKEAKNSFSSTVSGVDLIVGARSGSLNLLLYSVFRMGSPVNNIDWQSYQGIADNSDVAWTIPISLGDSHRGFRVMGTTVDYFEHYRYGNKRNLEFAHGAPFGETYDVVMGAGVAKTLNYQLGDAVVLSHGIGETSFTDHSDYPFKITGILRPTGTPVDQTVHVRLDGIEAIHLPPGVNNPDLQPSTITAFMVGLKSRMSTFSLQREVNEFKSEALTAILPGVALSELWSTMAMLEGTLQLVSSLVFVAALLGMAAMMAATIRERRLETTLLRIIGAPAGFLFILFQLEAILISVISILGGAALLSLTLVVAQKPIAANLGLHLSADLMTFSTLVIVASIMLATIVVASLPAFQAYSQARKAS